ncbi:MAG: hypothetical protein JKY48_01640, partial [Flavobacteriales bacterium]|nr:hypothetical protein [Flavobacteriales bacterium]
SDILSFIDTNVYCNILYSYRIKAIGNEGLKLGSYSDTASLVMNGIALQHKVPVINATVKDNVSVHVSWARPSIAPYFVIGYIVYRSESNNNFIPISYVAADKFEYEDREADVKSKKYLYKIEVLNACPAKNELGNQGSSIFLETVQLNENSGQLKWNAYELWDSGVEHYKIQKLNKFNQWKTVKELPSNKRHTIINF